MLNRGGAYLRPRPAPPPDGSARSGDQHPLRSLHIAILGLGYVGATTAACLTRAGHHVYGVDISAEKLRAIAEGRSPVVEPGVEELLQAGVRAGRLQRRARLEPWLDKLDLAVICVGTPSRADGKLDLTHLLRWRATSAAACQARRPGLPPLLLVFRSDGAARHHGAARRADAARRRRRGPGRALRGRVQPRVPARGDGDQGLLRPAQDRDRRARARGHAAARGIYEGIDAPAVRGAVRGRRDGEVRRQLLHALKVAFANEVGRIASRAGSTRRRWPTSSSPTRS